MCKGNGLEKHSNRMWGDHCERTLTSREEYSGEQIGSQGDCQDLIREWAGYCSQRRRDKSGQLLLKEYD